MANTQSALKRVRQNETRANRNRILTSRMKTLRKKAIASAEAGDKDVAQKSFSAFVSAVDKCTKNNIIHKNKAANIKSKTQKHLVG